MSLLFNMLSRLVIAFVPRSKHLNFMAGVTICSDPVAQENKVCNCLHCFPICLPWSDGTGWWDWMPWSSFFDCWVLNQLFHSPLSPSSSSLFAISVVSSAYLRLLIFLLAILIPACASFSSYQSLLDLTVILSWAYIFPALILSPKQKLASQVFKRQLHKSLKVKCLRQSLN